MTEDLQKIYENLQDEESRRIFLARLQYLVTKDVKHIYKMIGELPEGNKFYGLPKGENDYIFGCGVYGNLIREHFPNNWKGFIDNDSQLWGGVTRSA